MANTLDLYTLKTEPFLIPASSHENYAPYKEGFYNKTLSVT
ncbi:MULTISPECIES: hypothetical protein [Cellulophaga]|nr:MULTISPECIES: hypothetical protein [Cellulophaga]